MVKTFKVTDLRQGDTGVFPNLDYRFSTLGETDAAVVLERDFLGENPLHYYSDIKTGELIVANNIWDIKDYLKRDERIFTWEHVRAVSNNTRTTIDDAAFTSASPTEEEMGPTLQEYELPQTINYADIASTGKIIRKLLQESIEARLSTIADPEVGLLLSGGLDSMSVGYLLSEIGNKKVTAFTLKVDEDDLDVVKSRELAQRFNIDLCEVKIKKIGGDHSTSVSTTLQRYSPTRKLLDTKQHMAGFPMEGYVSASLHISGNPKKDNLFCAVAMLLMATVVREEEIKTVFCGEGPNEMINDYGFNPRDSGFDTDNKGDTYFREALTFGLKKTDRQLGRGGLAKHATARMGKIFGHYGLRLEAPYFNRDIARIMTRVPHITSYNTIKQHLVNAMFEGEGLDSFIRGTSKEKFQDGSGISKLFEGYDQKKLIDMFEQLYGIRKTTYL